MCMHTYARTYVCTFVLRLNLHVDISMYVCAYMCTYITFYTVHCSISECGTLVADAFCCRWKMLTVTFY